jgi:hypothetical protein
MAEGEYRAPGKAALSRRGIFGLGGLFLGALLGFGWLFAQLPTLPDTDSYYHLAIGRAYAAHGLIDGLPWARFSLMFDGFGDKELLFHLLLAPFGGWGTAGGRWALAALNAATVTALAGLGRRLIGPAGWLVPLVVYAGSLDFLGRAIRLRPESLALLLFLAATYCAATRRYRLLGAVALAFTLSYTAFHALLGLCLLFAVATWLRERRLDWPAVLYPTLGAGLGLIAHPHFPHNLLVWKVQSIDFFTHKALLDVGQEIAAPSSDRLLWHNLAAVAALAALAWAARSRTGTDDAEARADAEREAAHWLVAALVFGGLFLLMARFSTYALPFAALATLAVLRARGLEVGPICRLPLGLRLPTALALALALLPGLWAGASLLRGMSAARGAVEREAEWAQLGQALPPGAKVAAEWGLAQIYLYFAPQASFLNVLDPVFMAVPYPKAYGAQRLLFAGQEPDTALTVARELDSEFLAFSAFHPTPLLAARLDGDPRWVKRHHGYSLLYQLQGGRNGDFLLDWRMARGGDPAAGWAPYPRAEAPAERALEAFVDLRRVPDDFKNAGGCALLAHAPPGGLERLELAPAGPTSLSLGGREAITVAADLGAVLGRGAILSLEEAGEPITVRACPPRAASQLAGGGFYLRRLAPATQP